MIGGIRETGGLLLRCAARVHSQRTESGGTEEESQSDTEYSQIYTDYYGCQPQSSYPVKWR